MNGRAFLPALLAVAVAGPALAGTIRHDVADATYLALGADPRFAAVGQIKGKTSTFSFSAAGTMIAPNWVLTSAHVADRAISMDFKIGGGTYKATQWFTFPGWTGDLKAGFDMALLRFDVDLAGATGIAPAERYRRTDELGKAGVAVGFGRTGTGLTGATVFDQKKRAGQNMLDRFMAGTASGDRILVSDFDRPGVTSESSMGSATPLAREFMISSGDSGGGLFVPFNSKFWLAGVHSFGYGAKDGGFNADYGDASGHVRVSSFNAWIDQVLAEGGVLGASRLGSSSGLTALFAVAVPEPPVAFIVLLGLAALWFQNHLRRLRTQSSIGIRIRITRHRIRKAQGA